MLTRHHIVVVLCHGQGQVDHAQKDPVCLLLFIMPEATPRQVPKQLARHPQLHNQQLSQTHHFYTPELASGLQVPIARTQIANIDFDLRICKCEQHSQIH
jgi:hypothetical protein